MEYLIIIIFLVVFMFVFFAYSSFSIQLFFRKLKTKKKLNPHFKNKVKGDYFQKGYFQSNSCVLEPIKYANLNNDLKNNLTECYNVLKFSTNDVSWEMFCNLVKDGLRFYEILNIRAFPKDYCIRSEGSVEKNYSRLNIYTNNIYLSQILENDLILNLKWLIKESGDTLFVSSNNLHYKAQLDLSKISDDRLLDMIKAMNSIKQEIYKKDIIEY